MLVHLAQGGLVYFESNGRVIEAKGDSRYLIMKTDSIPVTMKGATQFQVAKTLAAIAACRAFGLSARSIKRLQTFKNETNNPGRNSLYRVGKGFALIDCGHNPEAFAAICRMAARWQRKTVTGIIGVSGDRDDELICQSARIAAQGFQRIIIKEDKDLRGRQSGEVARLLCETVNKEAPERRCEIVLDEVEAFEKCLRELQESEVVVLFYDKLKPIMEILERHEAVPVADFENPVEKKVPVLAF